MNDNDLDEFGLNDSPPARMKNLKPGNKTLGAVLPKTRHARELFLVGNGDGKPIRSVQLLAQKSGCSEKTISRYLPQWQKESEYRAISGTVQNRALGRTVTPEILGCYEECALVMQSEVERLSIILPKLQVGTDLHADTLKLYIQSLKSWADLSGITAHFDLAITAQKEMIKQAARLKAKGEADRTERQASAIEFK